jgi:hypothetical protein
MNVWQIQSPAYSVGTPVAPCARAFVANAGSTTSAITITDAHLDMSNSRIPRPR